MLPIVLAAAGLLFAANASAADAEIVPLQRAASAWQPVAFRLDGAPSADNNFDPERIRIEATFAAPSGATKTAPAFWYQDYAKSRGADGGEILEPKGEPHWRVRFTPEETGVYALSISAGLAGKPSEKLAEHSFDVAAGVGGARRGWVEVAEDGRSFQTSEGRPLRLVGENICWPEGGGTFDYERWLDRMAASGQNFGRVWLAPWWLSIEHQPGSLNSYPQDQCWKLDELFRLAEARGIYLMISFDHHGMYQLVDPMWGGSNTFWDSSNPYSKTLGGPCAKPNDFFASATARAIYQKRLRYFVGRYGYSRNLLAWQFFNEIDNAFNRAPLNPEDVYDWHAEMAGWFKENDPYGHLVTTSLTGGADRPEMWRIEDLDFSMYHSYWDPAPARRLAELSASFVERYKKPFMVGEFGTNARNLNVDADPHFRGFRQGLWGGVVGGSVGSAMTWWWEDADRQDLYPFYKVMSQALGDAGWNEGRWEPIALAREEQPTRLAGRIEGAYPFSADIALNHFERIDLPGNAAIASPLAANRASERLSAYLRAEGDARYRPIQLEAWLDEGALLVLAVDSVAADAALGVLVDGKEIWTQRIADEDGEAKANGEIAQAFEVALPAGKRRIEIQNTGKGWLVFSSIRLARVLPGAFDREWTFEPEVFGLRGDGGRAILYAVSPHAVYPAGAMVYNPPIARGLQVELPDWPAGIFAYEWRSPETGETLLRASASSRDGALTLAAPDFRDDLICVVGPAR